MGPADAGVTRVGIAALDADSNRPIAKAGGCGGYAVIVVTTTGRDGTR